MNIDIFLEELDNNHFKVLFVQLNTELECKKANIKILCENVIRCWKECMDMYGDSCDFLPFTKTIKYYNCKNQKKIECGVVDNIYYVANLCKA